MHRPMTILLAEDNEDDILLMQRAFQKIDAKPAIQVVRNGEEAIRYLEGEGEFADRKSFPFPALIISDLNMPRKDGFDLIKWLRAHPECFVIPIVVLTTSEPDGRIREAYRLGANACMRRPSTFDELLKLLRITTEFWQWCDHPLPQTNC
jgi:CheY-like chemotaxis protein